MSLIGRRKELRWLIIILFIVVNGLEAEVRPDSSLEKYESGKSYFGTNKYIEFIAGNLPIVLSAPHGGYELPDEIKDRELSSVRQDKKTLELTLMIKDEFLELTGKTPYLIINRLHRKKLDPNREKRIAVQGDSLAEIAFREFHDFIDNAERDVYDKWKKGLYVDIHAHRSMKRYIELGYLIDYEVLSLPDGFINDELFIQKSSLKNILKDSDYSLSDLIRGDVSFGAILSNYGWKVLPSPEFKKPVGEKYFSGGYDTEIHAGTEKYNFSGFQIETHWTGLRDNDENMQKFVKDFVLSIIEFMKLHYKISIDTNH